MIEPELPSYVITDENPTCGGCTIADRCREFGCNSPKGATMELCDDCRKPYDGPAYYTFPTDACKVSIGVQFFQRHAACTGNLCRSCAEDEPPDIDEPSFYVINTTKEA